MNPRVAILVTAFLLARATTWAAEPEEVEADAYTLDVTGLNVLFASHVLVRIEPICSSHISTYKAEFATRFSRWSDDYRYVLEHGRAVASREGKGKSAEVQLQELEPKLTELATRLGQMSEKDLNSFCAEQLLYLDRESTLRGKVPRIRERPGG